ncbi:MAG: hypothetical protein V2A71_00290 [Candidatus Eisenbacteria bacterium]
MEFQVRYVAAYLRGGYVEMTRIGRLGVSFRRFAFRALPVPAIFVVSCASFQTSDAVDEIVRLREKCQELQTAMDKGLSETVVRSKVSTQARIHKDFEYLFTPTKLEILDRRFSSSSDPDEKEAVRRLRHFLVSRNIGYKQAGVVDDLLNFENETIISVDEKSVAYRYLHADLANEKNRDVRRKLYLASSTYFEADNVLLGQLVTIEAREIAAHGYSDYLAFFAEEKSFDPARLETAARSLLATSDSLYAALLEEICREKFNLRPVDVKSYDIPILLRMSDFDEHFRVKTLVDVVDRVYGGMGIPFKRQAKIRLTTGDADQLMEGTHVYGVLVPNDVRLSHRTLGGAPDFASLLHGAAAALHYANTTETLLEFKNFGTHSAREGYGFLFEYLLDDPLALDRFIKLPAEVRGAYFKVRAFSRLHEARTMCADYLLQLALLKGREGIQERYYDIMRSALKYELTDRDAQRALRHNDFFAVADRMRGLFLEPYMKAYFKRQFGDEWYTKQEAGRFLQAQWALGQKEQLSKIEAKFGADAYDWRPCFDGMLQLLRSNP